jgi:DNA polymerase III delta prime subunit
LLDSVTQEVEERLRQSLHLSVNIIPPDAALNLPKAKTPGQVEATPNVLKPWAIKFEDARKEGFELLPGDETIVEIFKRANQKLLILGAPGSGKTTSMLEIARHLVITAQQDHTKPIPVLLSLSSWQRQGKRKSGSKKTELLIVEWVVEELKRKYGVRQDVGREWIRDEKLFLLLDGLDEVRPEQQLACAEEINSWIVGDLEQRPCGLVVCCRDEEYEKVVRHKLALAEAVCLQPLEWLQIKHYLQGFNLEEVAAVAEKDCTLQELLKKPLFLSMFGLIVQQGRFDLIDWQKRETTQAKQDFLFKHYLDGAMQRELVCTLDRQKGRLSNTYGSRELPSRNQVNKALYFLANSLEKDFQSEFLVERLQPSCLNSSELERYRFIYLLISVAFLLPVVLFKDHLTGPTGTGIAGATQVSTSIGWNLIANCLSVSFPWLRLSMQIDQIEIAEKFSFKELFKSFSRNINCWMIFPSLASVSLFFIGYLKDHLNSQLFLLVILLVTPFTGVFINWIIRFIFIESRSLIDEPMVVNQGMKNSLTISLFSLFATIFSIFALLSLRLSLGVRAIVDQENLLPIVLVYFVYIVFMTLVESCGGFIKHLSLRLVLWFYGYAPPRYDLLLDYCTERLLLQRIGGRYRFTHRMLQEYFASMELD